MLPIILEILSILGIIVLILLGIVILLTLTVLFLPVRYSVYGYCKSGNYKVRVKLRWLFGLLQIRYEYPTPGELKAKLLWMNLLSSDGDKVPKKKKTKNRKMEAISDLEAVHTQNHSMDEQDNTNLQEGSPEEKTNQNDKMQSNQKRENWFTRIYQKIKYTILEIYGKIKHIFEEFVFYKDLLAEEDTKVMVKHGLSRVGKLLCKVKPKKLKAKLLVGTGSPDTTGYLLGVYGILSPHIKKPNYLELTPDFNQAVFEGSLYAKGHINAFQILKQVLPIVFDKKLRSFKNKLDMHKSKEAA